MTRGLALYQSLIRHSPPFLLRVLCLDDETHRVLRQLRLERLALTPLNQLERADSALVDVKSSRRPIEYYWTCGPAFLLYLLTRHGDIETLAYLDADLFCFSDPTPIYDELGSGDVLLVHHRWPPQARVDGLVPRPKGIFNVGVVVFRRSASALSCLRLWREQCLEWCFDRIEPGRFGDQKYLEEWPSRFQGVIVSQHKGIGLGPWNLPGYRYSYDDSMIWVESDPLVFFHFQGLRAVTRWLYDPAWRRYGGRIQPAASIRRRIYVPYVRELRVAERRIGGMAVMRNGADSVRVEEGRAQLLARMVRKRRFLLVTDTFGL